jgi:hypothetical protein
VFLSISANLLSLPMLIPFFSAISLTFSLTMLFP